VRAIVDAAHELLGELGLERMTTNLVAERAGVSVGSLYQYFPNKEAIVAAVGRRLDERLARSVARALAGATDAAAALVSALTKVDEDARVRALLIAEAPAGWLDDASARGDAVVCAALAEHLPPGAPERTAFVAYHAALAVVRAALVQRPELLSDASFGRELALLVRRYVEGAASRG
jgi:AcrR family transcriptional regulator